MLQKKKVKKKKKVKSTYRPYFFLAWNLKHNYFFFLALSEAMWLSLEVPWYPQDMLLWKIKNKFFAKKKKQFSAILGKQHD